MTGEGGVTAKAAKKNTSQWRTSLAIRAKAYCAMNAKRKLTCIAPFHQKISNAQKSPPGGSKQRGGRGEDSQILEVESDFRENLSALQRGSRNNICFVSPRKRSIGHPGHIDSRETSISPDAADGSKGT